MRQGDRLLSTPDTDASSLPEALRGISGQAASSWLGVPLKSHSGTVGALLVQNHSEHLHYTEHDCELLVFVSTQIAAAIERKQMLARLQQSALYDHLTQLPNRQLVYDRIKLALAKARRENGHLALLYLDLDRFKEVNDTLGHAAGDILLQDTAQRIVQCMRAADTVARFGGDEFVVLLENIDCPESVTIVTERIFDVLRQPFKLMDKEVSIVPSIGLAMYPQHGSDEQSLLEHADSAMYKAKKNGGDALQLSA